MLYTQIENNQAKYPACMLGYFVDKGIIASVDATEEELAAVNIVPVPMFAGQLPMDGYQYTVHIVEQSDGSWAHEVLKVEISEDQYQSNVNLQKQAVKADRDRMIASTDWIVTKSLETGVPVPEAWRDFRQALRDIPSQAGFPFEVVWPTKP
jgi:hypothetical protein